jgi:hypothetical protein
VRPGEQEIEHVLLVPRPLVPPNHLRLVERDGANGDPRPVLDELEIVGDLHDDAKKLQSASHDGSFSKPLERGDLRRSDGALVTPPAVSPDTTGDSF